uniref:ADAM cysteine-rich domain-containing protein n=1 Tax=Callorhinchus milii TaxID=7868 RepID=A0A4W3H579_CALMI
MIGNTENLRCTFLPRNVQCGKLQCQFDNDLPIGGGRAVIYSTSLTYQGVRYNCRGATFDNGDANNEGLVEPGTMCGEGKVCLDTKCQDVKVFGVETCNRKCNNHGVRNHIS